jgi:hypothetical protein
MGWSLVLVGVIHAAYIVVGTNFGIINGVHVPSYALIVLSEINGE